MSNSKNHDGKLLIFTGGHHTSGLVTALAARRRGWQVVWLGHKHSMAKDKNFSIEYQEVTATKIPFFDLKTGKIFGSGSLLSFFKVLSGLIRSLILLHGFKSKFSSRQIGVVSFGGYLAVPVVLAAWILRIPSLTHEQTMVGGAANRFISVLVKKVALTWSQSQRFFPKNKSVITGLPLRPEIIQIVRKPSQVLPQTIFITGGKQGSHELNMNTFDNLNKLLSKYFLIHQTGSNSVYNDFHRGQELKSLLAPELASRYQIKEYLSSSEISHLYSTINAVVGRSGAHTVYELGLLGIPSVLVPIPWASRDEQLENAKFLASTGLAVVLPQSKLSYTSLTQSLDQVISQKSSPLVLPKKGTENLVDLIDQTFKVHEA